VGGEREKTETGACMWTNLQPMVGGVD